VSAGLGLDQAAAPPARTTSALAAASDDPTLFFNGLAEARGGRFVRFGSGVALPGSDPAGIHAVPGDVNDDGCVDTADFDKVQQLIGQAEAIEWRSTNQDGAVGRRIGPKGLTDPREAT
jgi:hypothetical protein